MEDIHYICTGGCRGESEKPGVCQATHCPKHGLPLTECRCTGGKHNGAFDAHDDDKPQEASFGD
ncbi:MAG: hypothetical protein AAB372_00925 [Patescibacteria group bacterium]